MTEKQSIADLIQVVGGSPTAEELATVIALLQATHDQENESASDLEMQHSSSWSRNRSQLRDPITPGLGQWQAAYRRGL
ncbi:unannotated protein [freshwater metagenome]|jgi:hypothetical protein|uniref:Unannotated protein n=1 Tax=freshwater metagenome TaxID=449393 RepID=A0A6J6IXE3_9ZZZZ|nr:hypothetical protein [Actinomycetota bacterium]MSZ22889.1 hypothetical protein [Actinomycetota bacterium]